MNRMCKRFLECKGLTIEEATHWGTELAELQRDIMFHLGDLARYAEARWPDTHPQVWPEWISPGLLARAAGVCKAYPKEEDRHEATYTQHLQNAGRPDRQARLQAIVDKGLTSDESRKADQQERADDNRPRWCLAVDVNYFLHRFWFSSGGGLEAAVGVASWVQRTVARLKDKGLTDVVCAFDAPNNFRKLLTAGPEWHENRYKDRPPKDGELIQQLGLVRQLLEGHGFACVSQEGMEADDVMASFAAQFPAQFDERVTLLTQDKDLRQCLSDKCNILLDVEWTEDETSGDSLPEYKWLTAKEHTEGCAYNGVRVEEIPPRQWADFQALAGDSTDGVSGASGIGATIAAALIKEFGTVDEVIAAAKAEDERIKPKKREALIGFEAKLEVTRQLVTLRTDLLIPETTRV